MRKKMKKIGRFVKNNIIGFIIGVLITTTVGVGAATMFASSDVIYDNSSSGGNYETVQGAIDELYEKANATKISPLGTAIYFNPVTGTTCNDYTASQSTGTAKTGCLKWYIINVGTVGTDTIDLLLDHNTTYLVAWNSSANNANGPDELLTQLQSDTSSWTGVPARTDSYTDPLKGYTINYTGYRARLIEANELWEITQATNGESGWNSGSSASGFYFEGSRLSGQGASHYAWLFDYTSGCTSFGCNTAIISTYGYWTSSASATDSRSAWLAYTTGSVYNYYVDYGKHCGVRPVITISKSLISS